MPGGIDDALYIVPTFCDEIPRVLPARFRRAASFRVKDDDWRQIEFVSQQQQQVITAELDAVQRVRDESADVLGFRRVHVRVEPRRPLEGAGLSRAAVADAFVGLKRWHQRVGFIGVDGVIPGGFALTVQPGVALYGVERESTLLCACIEIKGSEVSPETTSAVASLLERFELLLVHWPGAGVTSGPAELVRTLLT
ncbi:MAG: hypothetical protein QOH79_3156 [Acidimicrobiaceae bacterium]